MSAVLDLQARTLLGRVHATVGESIATAEWDADAQLRDILRAARTDAHARVRAAARAKRERVAEHCRKAQAAAETRDRTSSFEVERALAARALAALPAALARRWSTPATRHPWCVAAADLAARRLVAKEWSVVAGADLHASEREAITARAAAAGARVSFGDARTDLGAAALPVSTAAGLRIAAGGVTIDATPDGLLADRAAVESLVLAALAAGGPR